MPENTQAEGENTVEEETVDTATNAEYEADPALKKHIIDILFDFVRTDEELNPVLWGYFTKFINSLLNHNRRGFFSYVFNPENKVVDYFIKHIYNRSISEWLIKILLEDLEHIEQKTQYVMDIINSFETQEYEGKLNSALVLSEISDNKNFVELFKSEKVNQRLFEILK